jgi:spore maturation protein SpmA/spore maturation protein SpmB
MVLNFIWIGFFLIAFVTALAKLVFWGDAAVFPAMVDSLFEMAQLGATLSLGYIGLMALWLGIMKIGEQGGAVAALTRLVEPFFSRLFPEIPKGHPSMGSMMMNFSANMLGLDNAATPLGLKAMGQLQELNPEKDRATNAQIMFLVLNTSGLTLIPISIITLRALNGAANPTDIFVPILIATYFASLAGLIAVALIQKINLLHPVVLAYLGGATALVIGIIFYFRALDQAAMESQSRLVAALFIFALITGFLVLGMIRKVNIYDAFIEGSKEGFGVAIRIIPYLVAMLVAIGVFRASGAMTALMEGIGWAVARFGFDTQFVDALPTAMMKPLSGGGARGMAVEAMQHHGVDSFVGRLACTFQGSTETTFYTLAVYFGAVSVRNTRYTVVCGLLADAAGFAAAIAVAYLFFGKGI